MSLNVIVMGEETDTFKLSANCVKEVLSLIKLQKGDEFVNHIIENNYKLILIDSTNTKNGVALTPEIIFTNFDGYDTLFILKDIKGNEPVELSIWATVMTAMTEIGVGAEAAAFIAEAAVILAYAAVSIGLNLIMSALSPTPEFSSDPAAKQNSSALFNGAPIIRNQGGSVPLIFGNPYAGAVLISSGVFSEEVSV